MTDPSERERRKSRWETRFAGWLVEKTPLAWTLAKQLVLTISISLFLGTGFVAWLFGFNILVSFCISTAIALVALFVYRSRS
jgi:hypothetical protein